MGRFTVLKVERIDNRGGIARLYKPLHLPETDYCISSNPNCLSYSININAEDGPVA